jgi:hypothetical protein
MAKVSVLSLDRFGDILGDEAIENIYAEASSLSEETLVHINSTY